MFKWIILTNLFCLLPGMTFSNDNTNIIELPDSLGEWKISSIKFHTPENLWDYIDGGAELFLSYGFSKVQTVNYSAEDQPDILVDIFDMRSAPDAFGVFSYSRYDDDQEYGQGSQHSGGLIIFWKDRYYISILAHPQTGESAAAIDRLARLIDREIGTTGPLPPELELLPEKDLDPHSIRYFHHYVWLNSLHFISHENILNIDDHTPAVMAKYQTGTVKSIVLIVSYPDTISAIASYRLFRRKFTGEAENRIFLKGGEDRWTGSVRSAKTVAIVLKAPDEEQCIRLLNTVEENIKNHTP